MSRCSLGSDNLATIPARFPLSLRWLLEIAEQSGRLMRWRLRLSEFDFEVRYKKGKANSQADALSRLATLGETVVPVDEEIPCFTADAGVVL